MKRFEKNTLCFLIFSLSLFCSCVNLRPVVFHRKPLIEKAMLKKKEVRISVVVEGDAYTNPEDSYTVSIVSNDTAFESTCFYKAKEIKKVLTKKQVLQLAEFEKKGLKENSRSGLSNNRIVTRVGAHISKFNIPGGGFPDFDILKNE